MPPATQGRRTALLGALLASLATLSTAEAQPAGGTLVLYTSQPEPDAQATVAAFRAVHPGVTVDWVRGGTNQIIPRLRAEFAAGSPRPDVLLIADALTMESLKAEHRLQAWPEAPLGGTNALYHDPQKFYFGTKLITTGIVRHARAPAITAWRDLLAPAARNLAVMPSPAVSGAAALHVLAIAQNPALGWPYWEALARQQGMQARGGNGQVLQAVASGEKGYGMIVDFLPLREAAKGAPISFVFPEEGVTAITEPAAILATARNLPAARAFIAFLLSRAGQETAARMGYLPADASVPPPPGFPDPRSIRVMPFDAARALSESDAALKRFGDLFGG